MRISVACLVTLVLLGVWTFTYAAAQGLHGGRAPLRSLRSEHDADIDSAILGVDRPDDTDTAPGHKRPTHRNPDELDAAIVDHRLRKAPGQEDAAQVEDSEEGEEEFVYEDQDQEESGNEEPDEIYEASEEHGFVEEPTFPEDAFAQAMVKERGQWRKRWEAGHKAKPHRQQGNRRDAASAQKAAQGHGAVRRATREEQGVKGEAGINGKGASDQPRAIPVALVVMMTIVMAFAAGLGALPFFFVGSLSRHWSGLATAVACGVMFAASFDLIHEGQPYGGNLVILGIFLGGFFISAMQKWLDGMEDVKFGHLHGSRARRLVLMVGIMAAHAMGEGCGVGVSFCGERGWAQGVLTTLAIGVHNVPEGLAKATMLVSQGASAPEALIWSVLTCLPQPLVAVPAFLFVEAFQALLPVALGFAAGCMIWMVFAELLPDALKDAEPAHVASCATVAAAGLEAIRMAFESLEGPSGAMQAPWGSVNYTAIAPALSAAAVATGAAALVGSTVGRSALPTAALLGFSGFATAALGGIPLLDQLLAMPQVPALHTACAAVAGALATLLLRRSILLTLGGASPGAGGAGGAAANGKRAGSPTPSESSLEDMEGARAWPGEYNGYSNGGALNGASRGAAIMRRGDGVSMPDSPSKSKGAQWSGIGTFSKDPKRILTVPARAAGLVTCAALLTQAIALGWQFARDVALETVALPHAAALALALRGLVAGAAARAVFGASRGAGGALGGAVAAVFSFALVHGVASTPGGAAHVVRALSYPIGWTETVGAFACGALAMAAVMQFAVAMSMSPRHARFGVLLGMMVLGVVYGTMAVGCHVFASMSSCSVLMANLQ